MNVLNVFRQNVSEDIWKNVKKEILELITNTYSKLEINASKSGNDTIITGFTTENYKIKFFTVNNQFSDQSDKVCNKPGIYFSPNWKTYFKSENMNFSFNYTFFDKKTFTIYTDLSQDDFNILLNTIIKGITPYINKQPEIKMGNKRDYLGFIDLEVDLEIINIKFKITHLNLFENKFRTFACIVDFDFITKVIFGVKSINNCIQLLELTPEQFENNIKKSINKNDKGIEN